MSQSLEASYANAQSLRKPVYKSMIPEWFVQRNITLFSDIPSVLNEPSAASGKTETPFASGHDERSSRTVLNGGIKLPPSIRGELLAHVSTSLLIKTGASLDNPATRKAHVHLQPAADGAIYFLDDVVESIAKDLEADIVRLDGQDFEELLESLSGSGTTGIAQSSMLSPGADGGLKAGRKDDAIEGDQVAGGGDMADDDNPGQEMSIPLNPLSPPVSQNLEQFVEQLVSAPTTRRNTPVKRQDLQEPDTDLSNLPSTKSRTIVYLRDFQAILKSSQGKTGYQTFLDVVQNRRKDGVSVVLIIGDHPLPAGATEGSLYVCNCSICCDDSMSQYYHVIKIPAPTLEHEKETLRAVKEARTLEINLRNIQTSFATEVTFQG
jgi:hypothetical protein